MLAAAKPVFVQWILVCFGVSFLMSAILIVVSPRTYLRVSGRPNARISSGKRIMFAISIPFACLWLYLALRN
ncbi:MAG: hypothetical protein ACJ78X_00765, partial [Myxococcales bacterium]